MDGQLPPHLSLLLNRLCETGRSFIELYEDKEDRMQAIVRELFEISAEVIEMQENKNATRIVGAVVGVTGAVVAWLTGRSGQNMAGMAVFGTLAIGGAVSVIAANRSKEKTEKIKTRIVEQLVEEFLTIVELHKDALKRVKRVSEELEKESSSLMTKTGAQAKKTLLISNHLLSQTAKLTEQSREVRDVTVNLERKVKELLDLLGSITRIIPTPGEDKKLVKYFTESASKCQKTVDEFVKMRNMLKDFDRI